jgi:GNAT superfamily N-acetyltransferase
VDRDERRRLADENLIAAFSLVQERLRDSMGGTARFGAVHAIAVGVDVAFYNPVLALDAVTRPEDVLTAIEWIEEKGLPASVQARDDVDTTVRPMLEALGLVADPSPTPAMVLEPIGPAPAAPVDLEIRIDGRELLQDWHAALESGAVFRRIFGRDLVADQRVRLAVGYLDGQPVSSAAAIRSGATIGVYAVATVERARRRGIGRAVTWAAIDAARSAWGGTIAILQSSDMGLSVYRSMGFEEVARYTEYQRPKADP